EHRAPPSFPTRRSSDLTAGLMVTLDVEADLAEPVLVAGLKEPNEALKVQAAHALAQRGLHADAVLPVVTAGLKNELASVRQQARSEEHTSELQSRGHLV